MELEDAVHIALLTMKENFEGEMNETNIEIGIASDTDGEFRLLSQQEIKDYLREAA